MDFLQRPQHPLQAKEVPSATLGKHILHRHVSGHLQDIAGDLSRSNDAPPENQSVPAGVVSEVSFRLPASLDKR